MKSGFPARKARSYQQLEREAARARQILVPEIPVTSRLHGIELLDRLPNHSVQRRSAPDIPIDYSVGELPRGVMAQTSYEAGVMLLILSPETYAGLEHRDPRAEFTLFHETGHLWLHDEELVKLSRLPHSHAALMRGSSSHKIYQDTEWQADGFAAAFRAPASGIAALQARSRRTPQIADLQRAFGLSAASAHVRLRVYWKHREDLLNI